MRGTLKTLFIAALSILLVTPGLALYAPDISVTVAKYEPFPAEPGKYVTVWFKVENDGTDVADDVKVELMPDFPFSLDPGYKTVTDIGILGVKEYQLVKYKILVDSTALDGDNDLKVRYRACDFCMWVTEDLNLNVAKATNAPELELLSGIANPAPYPGGTSDMSVDIVNTAPGTAYYVLVELSSDVADIEPNKIYVGNLEPDDIDSIDFTATFKDVEPGTYPLTFKIRYKDSDYNPFEDTRTVNLKLKPESEVAKGESVPLQTYALYIVVAIVAVWFLRRKGWLFGKKEESI